MCRGDLVAAGAVVDAVPRQPESKVPADQGYDTCDFVDQ
jgi:hypothetical protein